MTSSFRSVHTRLLLAAAMPLCLIALPAPLAAQSVTGSGVVPTTQASSAERPIAFANSLPDGGALVILASGQTLSDEVTALVGADAAAQIGAAMTDAKFTGKAGSSLVLRAIAGRARIHVMGVGSDAAPLDVRRASGSAAQALLEADHPVHIIGAPDGQRMAEAALGYTLGQYRFDRYKTARTAPPTHAVTLVGGDLATARQWWTGRYAALADGMRLTRNLINEPANVLYPESFVAETRAALAGLPGVSIEVLDEAAMRRLNMGAILSVGQGSRRPPRMMIVRYRGEGSPDAPLALVGKGITFDTGGISIKPALNMWNMRADMSGAAAVMGTTLALAKSRAPAHVVAVAALAENMVDGNATRPGDVIRTLSGKTIEVLNTDAEGRMVLADALEYAERQYRPRAIVDIATLTGAVVGALGNTHAGLFSRHDVLASAVDAAGSASGNLVWRLPLDDSYARAMTSDIADLRNISMSGGPGAGVAAHFLSQFVSADVPWVHLDIAGVNRSDSAGALGPMGATGYGVALMEELARSLP